MYSFGRLCFMGLVWGLIFRTALLADLSRVDWCIICLLFVLVVIALVLSMVIEREHDARVRRGCCQWCKKYIEAEDRVKPDCGLQIMCPHCWEYTRFLSGGTGIVSDGE